MLLQLFTVHKRSMNPAHQFTFFLREAVRISRIHRWEIRITQRILLSFIHKDAPFKINLMQQLPILHVKIRTAVDNLRFQLKLNKGDSLVHLRNQPQGLLIVFSIRKVHFRSKERTRIFPVSIHGKGSKRQQIDAVSIFQGAQVGIAQRHTNHVGDAGIIARSSTHP